MLLRRFCLILATALPLSALALPDSRELRRAAPDANPQVLDLALQAMSCARQAGMSESQRLAVIDYSLPSTQPRLWVFSLADGRLLMREHVAHGRNTGANMAQRFSNEEGSFATSLGLFRTGETYEGGNGYSLRLDGLDPGFNDQAMRRAIVMHGAPYVDADMAQRQGRLGRSLGCPAVRMGIARQMIDTLKGGQFIFSYYPDQQWLSRSPWLNCTAPGSTVADRDSPRRKSTGANTL